MRAVIRVDSSIQIGSGHLMRCLYLAEKLKKMEKANVYFVCRELDGHLSQLIMKAGYPLFLMKLGECNHKKEGYAGWLTVSQEIDAEETIQRLKTILPADLIVIDHYALDFVWEQALRPYTKKIMVLDDLANRRHDCDILLDQNYYFKMQNRYIGLVPDNCKILLGPRYVMLRDEFYKSKVHLKKRDGEIRHILVFYGGSDNTNETMKALQAIVSLQLPNVTVDVIVGGSNPYRREIEQYCREYTFMSFYYQVNNMAELMNRADLCLGAGGGTTWERIFLELPSIVTAVAENQVLVCENCAEAGFITYLGIFSDVSTQTIAASLRNINTSTIKKQVARMASLWNDVEVGFNETLFT